MPFETEERGLGDAVPQVRACVQCGSVFRQGGIRAPGVILTLSLGRVVGAPPRLRRGDLAGELIEFAAQGGVREGRRPIRGAGDMAARRVLYDWFATARRGGRREWIRVFGHLLACLVMGLLAQRLARRTGCIERAGGSQGLYQLRLSGALGRFDGVLRW